MNMNFMGSLSVGDAPRVIAVIAGKPELFPELAQKAKDEGADILEFRADFCYGQSRAEIRQQLRDIKRIANLPVLLTIRQFPEGGYFAGTEAERLDLFNFLLSEVDAVDVELYAKEIRDQVLQSAHALEKLVVLSYHNFKHTPCLSKINEVVEDAMIFQADMVKISVTALEAKDVNLISRFTAEFDKEILLTTISMGEVGTVSRVLNTFLGSCFTYGFVGPTPTTPGQIQVRNLRKLIDEFAGQQISDVTETEKLIALAIQDDAPVKVYA